ncbi:hypothetical protein DZB84_18340 [Bacillus sp. HNG]|nr:hypothetical protein DZB84_18340 [Bacillus sp. HNG]
MNNKKIPLALVDVVGFSLYEDNKMTQPYSFMKFVWYANLKVYGLKSVLTTMNKNRGNLIEK